MDQEPSPRRSVLFVDDQRLIRTAYMRQLRRRVDVVEAQSGEEALALVASTPALAVIIADYQMAGMNGLDLLARAREVRPDAVGILFTGKADVRVMARAINEVGVYRVLLKPCEPTQFWESLDGALDQYEMQVARTAAESARVAALLDVLIQRTNPPLYTRVQRLQKYVRHVCTTLALPSPAAYEMAALLSCLGLVTFDRALLDRYSSDKPDNARERALFEGRLPLTAEVIRQLPAFEDAALMVARASAGCQHDISAETPASELGPALLHVAFALDRALCRGMSRADALAQMRGAAMVPARLLDALANVPVLAAQTAIEHRRIAELEVGMVFAEPVCTTTGLRLAPAGQAVTQILIDVLFGYSRTVGITEPLSVHVMLDQ